MKLGKIAGNGENPFLKKNLEEMQPNNINNDIKTGDIPSQQKINPAQKNEKIGPKEGAASANAQLEHQKIDRNSFTKEDEMQEIDLNEFEDDF